MFVSASLKAQREVHFTYDNAGNMTSRKIIDLSTPEKAENKDNADNTENTNDLDNFYEDFLGEQEIKIYPNPTKGKLVVEIPSYQYNSNDKIEIVNIQGSMIMRIQPISTRNTISFQEYANSTYILLMYINGKSTEWKIIKQQ
jgi:hypothetical protein